LATAVAILASVSVGLPAVWLAWVPVRNASRSGAPSVSDRTPGTMVSAGPAGRALAEVTDPFALEVHRPVQPEDPPPGLPELPGYVPREHDTELGSVVQAAGENWTKMLKKAWDYAGEPCNGVSGPLTRIHPRPASSRAAEGGSRDGGDRADAQIDVQRGSLHRRPRC
jgi:hypothetical protein